MPEYQVPDVPNDRPDPDFLMAKDNPPQESQEDFDKRLSESGYGNLDWSEADKSFLRASGLI